MMAHSTEQLGPAPQRTYHWTLPRQRAFLEHFAISGCVSHAAQHVGVSPRAAYDLRHRRDGLLFGVGWGAAVLLARHRLTDLLLERAIDGVEEVAVRSAPREDGSAEIRRRKYDGRLGMTLLARLDRMVTPAADSDPQEIALYRAVAQDFESFLDRLSPPSGQAPLLDDVTAHPNSDTNSVPDATASRAVDATDPGDLAAAHAALAADARVDAELRVAAHLAAQADGASPLARLARESGIHYEVAQKTVDLAIDEKAAPAPRTPPKPTPERANELHQQIHDLLDKIEDMRAAADLNAIDIRWDSCELGGAVGELIDLEGEERLMAFALTMREKLAPYGAAWRELDPAEIDPDSELARNTAPRHFFASVEMRREDSIKGRLDRLIAVGNARAVQREAEDAGANA